MPKLFARLSALALVLAAGCAPTSKPAPPPPPPAASHPIVGGASMYPDRTIFQNASTSADHRTLISAATATGAAQTLSGQSAYTLFAPTDDAFRRLPNGTVEALMSPRSRPELTALVNYHIVPGAKTRSQILADVQAGGGSASYRTQQGQMLRVRVEAGRIVLADPSGRRSAVTQADVTQSNGVLHVVDAVLIPAIL